MNKKCNAITKTGDRCTKTKLWLSKYCWWHQDYGIIITIIITIAVSAFFFYLQDKKPSLSAKCYLLENNNPYSVKCTVENNGRAEAKDVYLSFNKLLPLETDVFAKPEYGEIRLVEANRILDPRLYPESIEIYKAFSVYIPRIAPNHPVTFTVKTTNSDNIRAGKQILYLEKEIIKILENFYSAIAKKYPDVTNGLNQEILAEYRMKRYSFFVPSKLCYEKGIQEVLFVTEKQKLIAALHKDLFNAYKKEFIAQNTSVFLAPVIRIKTSSGETMHRYHPPYLRTYMEFNISSKNESGFVEVPVPDKYDFEK